MTALPPSSDFTGGTVTQGQFRAKMNDLRDYLNGLLGSDGTDTTARATLGLVIGTHVDAFAPTATQAEAEAGTGTAVRNFTPQRIAQAIAALSVAHTSHIRKRYLTSGTIYTPKSDVRAFYALVYGATGGCSGVAGNAGVSGPGYSEKYYPSPSGSYTYSIGAAGLSTGTAGGTTTFDVMTVTGSAGVTSATPTAAGAGSGGDFNATGGTGGAGRTTSTVAGGGGGGAGSRAGNGGNGAAATSGVGGGGGGTGGNNASGATGGAAGTNNAGSLSIPFFVREETYAEGGNGSGADGAAGANATFSSIAFALSGTISVGPPSGIVGYANGGKSTATAQAGSQGFICILEVLK